MEYAPHESRYTTRGCFLGMLMIILGIIGCGSIFFVAVDSSCVSDADLWLVDYPNSRLEYETYTFLRPFGIGRTQRVLFSPDPINAVRAWYMDRDRRLIEANNIKNRNYARLAYLLDTAPDGEGTIIALVSTCANELSIGMDSEKVSNN